MFSDPVSREAHVDYVTLTMPASTSELQALRFVGLARDVLADHAPIGEWKPVRRLGYAGSAAGSAFHGARPDGWLLQVAGQAAHDAFGQDWPSGTRCSRIDLAVTAWYKVDERDTAVQTADAACLSRALGGMHRSTRITLVDGRGDGDTVYIGSRASDQMMRVYDKGREAQDDFYQGAWRWEIEYKAPRAQVVWEGLLQASESDTAILATVVAWLAARGMDCAPGTSGDGAIRTVVPRTTPDDAAALDWLATGVAPTVERLICHLGNAVVYSALGLPS